MNKSHIEQLLEDLEFARQHSPDKKAIVHYGNMERNWQERYKQLTGHYYIREVRR